MELTGYVLRRHPADSDFARAATRRLNRIVDGIQATTDTVLTNYQLPSPDPELVAMCLTLGVEVRRG